MTSTTADPALDNPVDTTTPEARVARPSVLVTVLTTSDHKVVGQLYIGASMLGALIVGVLGVLLGAERIDGDGTPGEVVAVSDEGVTVQAAGGRILMKRVRPQGGDKQPAAEWAAAAGIAAGTGLGN